ncbi:MAG: AAA family ATPase [Balneolaceae bacterium]
MNISDNVYKKTFWTPSEVIEFVENQPELEFIWGPISEGTTGIVVGPAKLGKTTLTENLSCNIAAGRDSFLGKTIGKNDFKIALALLEEPIRLRGNRHKKIINSFNELERELIESRLTYLGDYPGYLTSSDLRDKFYSDVKENSPNILVIDSLSRLTEKKISESDVASKVMKWLRKMNSDLNMTTIVIHHTTKLYDSTFPSMDNIKGSTEIIQESDYAIGIGKMKGMTCFKTIVSRYHPEEKEYSYIKLNENNTFTLVDTKTEEQALKDSDGRYDDTRIKEFEDKIIELINNSDNEIVKTSQIIESVEFGERQVFELLKKLKKDGKLEQPAIGKYKLMSE